MLRRAGWLGKKAAVAGHPWHAPRPLSLGRRLGHGRARLVGDRTSGPVDLSCPESARALRRPTGCPCRGEAARYGRAVDDREWVSRSGHPTALTYRVKAGVLAPELESATFKRIARGKQGG